MSAKHTSGPWHLLDQRASTLESLGWSGPEQDAIIISRKAPRDILASAGDNCVVCRIEFRNRAEMLGEGNMSDARLIAAAPDLLEALREILGPLNVCSDNRHVRDDQCLPIDITVGELRKARAAIAKAEGIDCEHA